MTRQHQVTNNDNYVPILDSGFLGLVNVMGDDDLIVRAARVSYGEGTKSLRENTGLIRYLMKHEHTSPFEMVEFLFHIKMPIFLARQHIRHRTASINEYSGRYSEMSDEFYLPDRSRLQSQDTINKQGSSDPLDSFDQTQCWELMANTQTASFAAYKKLLEPREASGNVSLSRELARIVLPVSNYTEFYWKIDLKNLLHYIKLRQDHHAQWEIQQYANAMANVVKQTCPVTYQAFVDYNQKVMKFSNGEGSFIKDLIAKSNDLSLPVQHAFNHLVELHGSQNKLCDYYHISTKELKELLQTLRIN